MLYRIGNPASALDMLCRTTQIMHPRKVWSRAAGCHEDVLQQVGIPSFVLDMRSASDELGAIFEQSRLQRSIGVLYQVSWQGRTPI